jgi:hypothetical protein
MHQKHHQNLSPEKWSAQSVGRQVLNIASELNRAGNWIKKGDGSNVNLCYERAFELVDLTVADPKWKGRTRELLRFRETLAELYVNARKDGELNSLLFQTLVAMRSESRNLLDPRTPVAVRG